MTRFFDAPQVSCRANARKEVSTSVKISCTSSLCLQTTWLWWYHRPLFHRSTTNLHTKQREPTDGRAEPSCILNLIVNFRRLLLDHVCAMLGCRPLPYSGPLSTRCHLFACRSHCANALAAYRCPSASLDYICEPWFLVRATSKPFICWPTQRGRHTGCLKHLRVSQPASMATLLVATSLPPPSSS